MHQNLQECSNMRMAYKIILKGKDIKDTIVASCQSLLSKLLDGWLVVSGLTAL